MDDKDRPIGVFDSGVGGVSVLRELVRLLPGERFLYYADTANAPYGTKTREQVAELSLKIARFLIEDR
ncbi:MAG TPA: glutamate racemase, partial [Clostridia bacterium]|nr:glutamate racemase [Clostridia bacterium]